MKINKIFIIGLISTTLCFTACDSKEDIKDNPIERVKKEKAKVNQFLMDSEHGWVVNYFPDDVKYTITSSNQKKYYGGYYLWMNFSENNMVSVRSDFNAKDLDESMEEYNFVTTYSFALNFPSQSKIHHFTIANPYYHVTDREFVYYKIDGEDIIFRGQTTDNFIRFRRATQELKENYLGHQAVRSALDNLSNIAIFGDGEPKYVGFYVDNSLGADGRVYSLTEKGYFKDEHKQAFGISCGSDVIVLSEPIIVAGVELREFRLVDGRYTAEKNNKKAVFM